MPAAVVNVTPKVEVWGRNPVAVIDVTWTDSDTYTAVDLGAIAFGWFVPTTNASYGLTFSANVATLKSGGSLTGKLILIGSAE